MEIFCRTRCLTITSAVLCKDFLKTWKYLMSSKWDGAHLKLFYVLKIQFIVFLQV